MKISKRKQRIENAIGGSASLARIKESLEIPECDTINRNLYDAYLLSDEVNLVSMLNTLKFEPQMYRSEEETMEELQCLIERIAETDPYFVAQAICWSRCVGEKMRTINHLAAAILSPFVAGKEWAKRFYGPFDRKNKNGGCVYRTDDMREIKDAYNAIGGNGLSSAMKKGFASAIEKMDNYQLAKYKGAVIDICNLAHPDSSKSSAEVEIEIDGEIRKVKTIDAILKGYPVSANTWEVANSEAGQVVSAAVKSGEIDEETAKVVLSEAKNDNWEELLSDGKLGMLAALRNIRNILQSPRDNVVDMLCKLVSDGKRIHDSGVMPYQVDLAYETVINGSFDHKYSNKVKQALMDGYRSSVPNLKEVMPGKTLVVLDCSGSMNIGCRSGQSGISRTSCLEKASLVAATIAESTDADIIRFGSYAERIDKSTIYYENVFELAEFLRQENMGGTNFSSVFRMITDEGSSYDRIIILSDNECNEGFTKKIYKEYVRKVCKPYIYCIDFGSYGTTQFKGDNVGYYFGYGYAMFDDIARREFNPEKVLDEIRNYKI